MEYQEVINLLDNTQNELSEFGTKNWFEINDKSRGTYNKGNEIKFKTSMTRWNICNYSDAYILVSGEGDSDAAKRADERNKEVIFENCAPFTDCISNINNTQIDNR